MSTTSKIKLKRKLQRGDDKIIGILCSDLHLSEKPPIARIGEKDWYAVMANYLSDINNLGKVYSAPILCAGDIFDKWKVSPELITFAINHLPNMYAIPGQHDLPLHSLDLIKKSAYYTLMVTGNIKNVIPGVPVAIPNSDIVVHGFPWLHRIDKLKVSDNKHHIAICHDYFWVGEHKYTTASEEHHASKYEEYIQGYHAVAFGDNHCGFRTKVNNIPVANCGAMMRRTVAQVDYRPRVYLITKKQNLIPHFFNITNDILDAPTANELDNKIKKIDLKSVIFGLESLQTKQIEYIEILETVLQANTVSMEVRKLVLESVQETK